MGKDQAELRDLVEALMTHGPCGNLNPSCPCMQNGMCTKNYPKQFQENTTWCEGGYPHYRRREFQDGHKIVHTDGVRDNRWVVPHNPRLLNKFKCHLNVEICTSIKAVKYLYKYTYKGPDRASMEVINEVTEFVDARYVTAPEACWRLFEFPMHARSHVVERLPVHLEGQEQKLFVHGNEREVVEKSEGVDTKLTAYFRVNNARQEAHVAACAAMDGALAEENVPLKYTEMPNHYVWDTKNCAWKKRQRRAKGGEVIARLFQCSPKNPELYALRLLLLHVPGALSYKDLCNAESVENNNSFRVAAKARNLIRNIDDVDQIYPRYGGLVM